MFRNGREVLVASRSRRLRAARRLATVMCSLMLCSGASTAQESLADRARNLLTGYARACDKSGDIVHARLAMLEALVVYAPGDSEARDYLLRTREELRKLDNRKLAAGRSRSLQRAWQRVAKRLADLHRDAAREAAGNAAEVARHQERVLRFAPEDDAAGRALGREEVEGRWLTRTDATIAVRTAARRQLLELLAGLEWPAAEIDTTTAPESGVSEALRAGVPKLLGGLQGFRGPSCEVWGTHGARTLGSALQNAERAGLLIRSLLAPGRDLQPLERSNDTAVLCVDGRRAFETLVDLSDEDDVTKSFVKTNGLIALSLRSDEKPVYCALREAAECIDLATRISAENHSGLTHFALSSGTAHAVCHWLLGSSLFYFIDVQQADTERTSTRELTLEVTLPEMHAWFVLAREQAWLGTGPKLFDLLGLDSSNMSDAARIRSWALSQYLLAAKPRVMAQLSATQVGARPADFWFEVEATTGDTERTLVAEIDRYWRHLELGPATSDSARLSGARQAAAKDLRALAVGRATAGRAPCAAVAGLPTASSEPTAPTAGPALRLVELPAAALRRLEDADRSPIPFVRHLHYAPELDTLRFDVRGQRLKIAFRPLPTSASDIALQCSPRGDAKAMPGAATDESLVADLCALLELGPESADRQRTRIGWPITLHAGSLEAEQLEEARCRVTADGEPVAGSMLHPSLDAPIHLAPPHTLVFVPHDPLPSGALIEVQWDWPNILDGRETFAHAFATK